MTVLGIVKSEDNFYERLWEKWKEYLWKLKSGKNLVQAIGKMPESPQDLKDNMEAVRVHLRGHNLYDIFYGSYKKEEQQILRAYIDLAPRDDFKDILDTIDCFSYFNSRKRSHPFPH